MTSPIRGFKLKIGLLWHSLSSGNLGVRALTQSHIDIVSRIVRYTGRECDIVLIGPRQPDDVTVSDYTYVELTGSVRSIANYYRVINSCDFILDIGSGDSFSDIYGAMRGLKILLSKWTVMQVFFLQKLSFLLKIQRILLFSMKT